MDKYSGMHMYICVTNYDGIIANDEAENGDVARSIHALDTFFTAIERYGNKLFPDRFVVEKITGARLHLYILADLRDSFEVVKSVSAYAYFVSRLINSDTTKFSKLNDLKINVGADFGDFYIFEFETEGYSEITSIGYVANYASKLQSVASTNRLSISSDVFDVLQQEEKSYFAKNQDESLTKYGDGVHYSVELKRIISSTSITDKDVKEFKDRIASVNLDDFKYSSVRKPLDFSSLNKLNCKEFYGIPLYVDVRGFTGKFYEDDSNIEEMKNQTTRILLEMYQNTITHGGVHVQFQGDRELSVFHNIPNDSDDVGTCFVRAITTAMRHIDTMRSFEVQVGVGVDYGRLFATKIGARGEKDNLLLGETLIKADKMEDCYAKENEIAITSEVYKGLMIEDKMLASQFVHRGDYYIASIGFQEYMLEVSENELKTRNISKGYNPAWRC